MRAVPTDVECARKRTVKQMTRIASSSHYIIYLLHANATLSIRPTFAADFKPRLFLTCMEHNSAPRRNGSCFASFRIPCGTLGFVFQLKVAEARQTHIFAAFRRAAYHFKKSLDHLLRFLFAQPRAIAQYFEQLSDPEDRRLSGRVSSRDRGRRLEMTWRAALLQLARLLSMS